MNEPFSLDGVPGPYTPAFIKHSFDATVEGFGAPATQVAGAGRNGSGVLRFPAVTNLFASNNDGALVDDSNGGTANAVAVWAKRATGSPPVQLGLRLQDAAYTFFSGPDIDLTENVWTLITWTPPAGLLAAHRSLAVYINGTGVTVDLDEFSVGSSPPALSGLTHWQNASRAAVTAIRSAETPGSEKAILVGGYEYSHAARWPAINGAPWITDPLGDPDRLVYVGHHYFDADGSGTYGAESPTSISGSLAAHTTKTTTELRDFTGWLTTYGLRGAVTEVGWPRQTTQNTAATAAEWATVAGAWFDVADTTRLHVTFWSSGAFWGDYELLAYVPGSGIAYGPATVLEAHPSVRVLSGPSADVTSPASATLTQTQTLTGSSTATRPAAATLNQGQTLNAASTGSQLAAATLDQAQTLTASATRSQAGAAALTQGQALTASGSVTASGAATLAQGQTLTSSADVTGAGGASLTQTQTLTAAASLTRPASASLVQGQTLTSNAVRAQPAAAILAQGQALTTTATATDLATALLAQGQTLVGTVTLARTSAAALVQDQALTAASVALASGGAQLTQDQTLTGSASGAGGASAALLQDQSLTAVVVLTRVAAAALLQGQTLTSTGTRSQVTATALTQAQTLTSAGVVLRLVDAALVQGQSLTSTATRFVAAVALLAQAQTLNTSGTVTAPGAYVDAEYLITVRPPRVAFHPAPPRVRAVLLPSRTSVTVKEAR